MTISNTVRTAGPFIGNGITKVFPFTYKVFAREDVLVALTTTTTGVESILTLDSDYFVTLNPNQDVSPGGLITMTVAPPVGTTLAATSNVALIQKLELTNQGGFYPKAINDALDKIVINIQQISARLGLGALNVGAAAQIAAVVSFISNLAAAGGATLVGYVLVAVGAVKRLLNDKLGEHVSPEDFGAVGTLAADDTAAVQKAIDHWALNPWVQIRLVKKYRIDGTLRVGNKETADPEVRLSFIGGGTLAKNNAGFMFDKPVGQALPDGTPLQTGHIYFIGTRFEGANLNGQTFILNGDNIIRTHFIGCFGTKINIAKAAGYLQTIYCTAGTTWRKWSGYLFDANYLFDIKWDGVAEAGDGFLITRDTNADPACNSLKISGDIEGLSGVSGPAIAAGVCYATEITGLYMERNAGGDIDFSRGAGFHKGLTIQSCGFQPSSAQLANANYYPVITGKGAENSIALIGNASTGNLFDVTAGSQCTVIDIGNWAPAGKKKFSPTSPRLLQFKQTKMVHALLPGFGVNLDSYEGTVGFEGFSEVVNGETVTPVITYGTASPQVSPGSFIKTNWARGSIVFNRNMAVSLRQYGEVTPGNGIVRDALILGWACAQSGTPGLWNEIPVMLPYSS